MDKRSFWRLRRSFGMGLPPVGISNKDSSNYGSWSPENGIQINKKSSSFLSGNYVDLYLTLKHENQHRITPDDFGTTQSKIEAYEAVVYDSSFELASEEYRANALERLNFYKEELRKEQGR